MAVELKVPTVGESIAKIISSRVAPEPLLSVPHAEAPRATASATATPFHTFATMFVSFNGM